MADIYKPVPAAPGTLNSVKSIIVDDTASKDKLVLAQETIWKLNDYLGSFNSLAPLGSRLEIETLGKNSVRILQNSYKGDYQELTDVGYGDATTPEVKSVVAHYSKTQYKSEKYVNGDIMELDEANLAKAKTWLAERLEYDLSNAAIASRRIAFAKIADQAGVHVTLSPTATGQEIYDLVVGEALKFLSYEDNSQGIQIGGIKASDITIYARPEWFQKVVGIRATGDATAQTFDLGITATAKLGGYNVIVEPGLPINTPFLIGTDSTALYDFKIIFAGVIQYETGDIINHSRIRDLFSKVPTHIATPTARVGSKQATSEDVTADAAGKEKSFLATAIRLA